MQLYTGPRLFHHVHIVFFLAEWHQGIPDFGNQVQKVVHRLWHKYNENIQLIVLVFNVTLF